MELSCPQCDTRFSIPEEALGPAGRKVRCSRCAHVWHAKAAEKDDTLTLDLAITPRTAMPDRTSVAHKPADLSASHATSGSAGRQTYADSGQAETAQPPDLPPLPAHSIPRWQNPQAEPVAPPAADAPRARWGGVILGLVLLAGIGLSYALRDQIAATLPATKPVFQLAEVPLEQVGDGLEFINLASSQVTENGQPLLRVTGFIQNTQDFGRPLPWVLIQVVDTQNRVVAEATQPPPQPGTIEPQGAIRIVYDLPQPEGAADKMSITMDFVEGPQS